MGKKAEKAGVYAGSFDPITRGHLDIIAQAATLFTRLHVMVGVNAAKNPLFSDDERVAMIQHEIDALIVPKLKNAGMRCDIRVEKHKGLTAAFMKANRAPFYVRGLRLGSEFDAEYSQLVAGKREYKKFTPVFLCTTDPNLQTVSSSLAREIERFNGQSINSYVTPYVAEKLKQRMTEKGLRVMP